MQPNPNLNWNPGMTIESMEKEAILQALRFYRGNKTATANALGIAIRTLDNKLAQYEIDDKKQKEIDANGKIKRDEFQRRARGITPPSLTSVSTETGVRLEPVVDTSKEHAVPLPLGSKVQEMPLQNAPASSSAKGRR